MTPSLQELQAAISFPNAAQALWKQNEGMLEPEAAPSPAGSAGTPLGSLELLQSQTPARAAERHGVMAIIRGAAAPPELLHCSNHSLLFLPSQSTWVKHETDPAVNGSSVRDRNPTC